MRELGDCSVNKLLEVSKNEDDGGNLIGRNPLEVPAQDWDDNNLPFLSGLKAIRAKCLDCSVIQSEVRKCVCITCPLWPLRMGSVPKGFRRNGEV